MKHLFITAALFLISISEIALTDVYAQNNNYPGGVVEFEITKESTDLPEVKYGIRDVTIIDQQSHWRILLGIDLKTLPGEYLVYVKDQSENSSAYSLKFEVSQQKTQFFSSITAGSTTSIYHDKFSDIEFENSVQPELPLQYPAKGQWADYFGYVSNSTDIDDIDSRNYISLTTTELTPVIAPHNAIVSRIVETSSENGDIPKKEYTLYLDHGRGLYSILTGVSDLTIETGNGVLAGAVLGKIHSSDDSNSQPNVLTWQAVLNGAYINPNILIKI